MKYYPGIRDFNKPLFQDPRVCVEDVYNDWNNEKMILMKNSEKKAHWTNKTTDDKASLKRWMSQFEGFS